MTTNWKKHEKHIHTYTHTQNLNFSSLVHNTSQNNLDTVKPVFFASS